MAYYSVLITVLSTVLSPSSSTEYESEAVHEEQTAMLITVKTLYQRNFKVELDDSETVCPQLNYACSVFCISLLWKSKTGLNEDLPFQVKYGSESTILRNATLLCNACKAKGNAIQCKAKTTQCVVITMRITNA